MQVAKGIYQLTGQAYGVHPNTYAVLGDQAVVLIDSATTPAELAVVDGNLAYWGLDVYPISHLLLTHSHFDHSGNAHIIRGRGAAVVAGRGDAEGIETGDERTLPYSYEEAFTPCRVDRIVEDGEVVHAAGLDFEVLHVPGHSAGSVAYRLKKDGRSFLFTGDVLMMGANGKAELGVPVGEDYNPGAYLQTLKRLYKEEADAVLAGHFQPCLRGASRLLKDGYRTGLFKLRTLTE